jgi:hypothetical protein
MSNSTLLEMTDASFTVDRSRPATPYAGLAATQHMSAPKSAAQGTTVSFAGRTAVVIGLDVATDAAPGSPPREAPV